MAKTYTILESVTAKEIKKLRKKLNMPRKSLMLLYNAPKQL